MSRKRRNNKKQQSIIKLILLAVLVILGIFYNFEDFTNNENKTNTTSNVNNTSNSQTTIAETSTETSYNLSDIPEYNNSPYIALNNNVPNFKEKEKETKSFEEYSPLDSLGRCGVAYANISKETMPPERRWKRRYKQYNTNRLDTKKI